MKKFILITYSLLTVGSCFAQEKATLVIGEPGSTIIDKNIYGQFAEHLGRSIYDGVYRNGKIRLDVVEALKKIQVPNLRWPGGCFADQYHWRDGIGEASKRPKTVNTTWGMVTEDNSFGTGEFMELCRLIGCEPYIAGNVGTGTPQEMKEWVQYLNYPGLKPSAQPVSLWGVGNESWGCGGNMTPEYYAGLYHQFAAFLPDYPGSHLKKIASGANADDYHWTEVLMKNLDPSELYGISLHYYTFPSRRWNPRGSATSFTETEYIKTLQQAQRMEEIVDKHEAIMDKYDPQKRVALMVDEWGVWADGEKGMGLMYQQSSLRDALVAATTLNIFNNHADRVRGANMAQAVNVIQSLILTKGDQMLLTPTYFVFDLYKAHQDAKLLPIKITSPDYRDSVKAINASASVKDGITHITIVNLDAHRAVNITLPVAGTNVSGKILTSAGFTDINTFEAPDKIKIKAFNGAQLKANQLSAALPPLSVVLLTIQ
jgi:alpha-N-arabinofuranosidase